MKRTGVLVLALALWQADIACAGSTGEGTDAAVDLADSGMSTDAVLGETASADTGSETWQGAFACVMDPACDRVMVASHRGYHISLPENSLAALRAAAAVGADFVEVDVRETNDGVLVLMHDSDVDRTTNGMGDVNALTWAQIQALDLDVEDGALDPEVRKVPTFAQALTLARELGVALYVDQKTSRTGLVLDAIRSGPYFDVAMVRDDLVVVAAMANEEERLWVMPAIEDRAQFESALSLIPGVRIVEISQGSPNADLTAAIRAAGVKAQQDVLAFADMMGALGDYTGWKGFVEAGVVLPQTDYPQLLIPAVAAYNATGVFPESGPGHE